MGVHLEDAAETILGHLRAGASFTQACEGARIAKRTGYEWLARGEGKGEAYGRNDEEPPEKYVEFAAAVREATAQVQLTVVGHWMAEIPGNWQAARDFLARRFPKEWGNVERREVEVEGGLQQLELELVWEEPPRLGDGVRSEGKAEPEDEPTDR